MRSLARGRERGRYPPKNQERRTHDQDEEIQAGPAGSTYHGNLRGAALTMASDLASTPVMGVRVQCCGDAHLCNFGGFATPERRVIFAINDLDETLPAPWEWDVKRLAASFVVACRDNGVRDAAARDVAMTCVRTYRESMAEFSQMKTLELWYYALGADKLGRTSRTPNSASGR